MKITITKLGAFDVKAVKKPSRRVRRRKQQRKFPLLRKGESEGGLLQTGKMGHERKGLVVQLRRRDLAFQFLGIPALEGHLPVVLFQRRGLYGDRLASLAEQLVLSVSAGGRQPGYMFTGWHEIGGKWYYFSKVNDSSLGAMAYDTTTPDGYKVDEGRSLDPVNATSDHRLWGRGDAEMRLSFFAP